MQMQSLKMGRCFYAPNGTLASCQLARSKTVKKKAAV